MILKGYFYSGEGSPVAGESLEVSGGEEPGDVWGVLGGTQFVCARGLIGLGPHGLAPVDSNRMAR